MKSLRRSYVSDRRPDMKSKDALPPIRIPKNCNLNQQRRQKLGQSLTQSYIQKFNDKTHKKLIENEVKTFLNREKITDKDLKELENTIARKIKNETSKKELTENLLKSTKPNAEEKTEKAMMKSASQKIIENNLNDSGMSGGSDLDKFDGKYAKDILENKEMEEFEKIKANEGATTIKKVEIDKSKYNDEWDAINMFQKHLFEEQRKNEKIKEWEMRMRNRADLQNQIEQKIKRKYQEELKEKEYDQVQEEYLKKYDAQEVKKKEDRKQLAMKEKEQRDKQLHERYVNKRIAFLKNKKYEKELVEHNNEEIKLAKETELENKKKEHEALLKTLKDNELHKQKLAEEARKQREDDIKVMEDAAANEVKRENERKAYYNSIQRNSQSMEAKAIADIISKRDEKLRQEDEIVRQYNENKERMEIEKEKKRIEDEKKNKIMLRNYYDQQIKNKKEKKKPSMPRHEFGNKILRTIMNILMKLKK